MPVKVDVYQAATSESKSSPSKITGEKSRGHESSEELFGSFETTFQQLLKRKCDFVCKDSKEIKGKSFELLSRGKKSCGHVIILGRTVKCHAD